MRKTSQDGGDSTSITSGFEYELKKPSAGIIKTKRNSIKKKVQNFSHESDDTVIEPLLQIDKNEIINRSAKYVMTKPKTESISDRESNKNTDNNFDKNTISKTICSSGTTASNSNISRTLHNHMNTNIFGSHDEFKSVSTVKNPVLVEINACRPPVYSSQSSSIFTTAKIHADSITKTMAPIQMTPVPIVSAIEGNIVKAGISPDYSTHQNRSIVTISSNNVSELTSIQDNKLQLSNTNTSYLGKLGSSSKSDICRSGNEDIVNKLAGQSTKVTTTTESELNSFYESCDIKMVNVIASSSKVINNNNEKANEITSKTSSSRSKILNKERTTNPEKYDGKSTKDNLKKKDLEEKTETDRSSLKTFTSKESDIRKKDDKASSNNGGSSKQLQRQKNAVLEDFDDHTKQLKKVTDKSDTVTKNDYLKFSKDKNSIVTTNTDKGPSSSRTFSIKNIAPNSTGMLLTQSTSSPNSNSVLEKKTIISSVPISTSKEQHTTTLTGVGMQSNAKETPTEKFSEQKLLMSSGDVTKSSPITKPAKSTASLKSDLTKEKNVSTKDHKPIGKDQISEPIKEKSTPIVTTKDADPKSAMKDQTVNSTGPTKPNVINVKNITVSSNQTNKTHKTSATDVAKPSTSFNANKCVTATSTSESKPTSIVSVPSGVNSDLKSTTASNSHTFLKPKTTTTPSVKTITKTTVAPLSTVSSTKTATISKSPPLQPSSTKSEVVISKDKQNNTSTTKLPACASSIPTTGTSTISTHAKSLNTTQKVTSKDKALDKDKKI